MKKEGMRIGVVAVVDLVAVALLGPRPDVDETVRPLTLHRTQTPVFIAYLPEEEVVSAADTVAAFRRFGASYKRLVPVEETADAAHHVLVGDILSPASTGPLVAQVLAFLIPLPP